MANSHLTAQAKYGVAKSFYFELIDLGTLDFETTPATFAAGDAQISQDGGGFVNINNIANLTYVGNGIYALALVAAEMQAAKIVVTIIDQTGPKVWEDFAVIVDTYGNASAEHAFDLDNATPTVNVTQIDSQATSGNNATLNLKQLNIVNNAGDALVASATGGNGDGISASGNGTGHGVNALAGATGNGILATGGGTSGDGINAAAAAGNGDGISAAGNGTGDGIATLGGATGHGVHAQGGATSGSGVLSASQAGNSDGLRATGQGTAAGIKADGGATGPGVYSLGGATSGAGIKSEAAFDGAGVDAVGKASGDGISATAGLTGRGIHALGGATSGDAIRAETQGGNSDGISGIGSGTGDGLAATAGATGRGIHAVGGATSGAGLRAEGTTNSDGFEPVGAGSGVDIDADITGDVTGNLSGSVGSATALGAAAVDSIWDEDIVAAHGLADTAGRCLRTLDAVSDRTNNSNVNALLGVTDAAGADVPSQTADETWDELISAHTTAGSFGERFQTADNGTAQAGAAGSITLRAGASAVNDFYNNMLVAIVGGTGVGQSRIIDDYTGASKLAAVKNDWVTNPDNTSVYVVFFNATDPTSAPSAATIATAVWNELEGAEPAVAAIANNASMRSIVQYLKRRFFNRHSLTSEFLSTYQDDSTTVLTTQVASDDKVTQEIAKSG